MRSGIVKIPSFFQWLEHQNLIDMDHILCTNDGFCMLSESVSDILISGGIETFPNSQGKTMECRYFFDDWFLFAVPDRDSHICGLLKMREQEDDRKRGIDADGDTPGVTISFISFDTDVMKRCLAQPTEDNRKHLAMEINRVVAYPKQKHHPGLKAYFIRPEAEAAYLVAEEYVKRIARFSKDGVLPVPEAYREICRKRDQSPKYARIPDFLEENNSGANGPVCDHQKIFIKDANNLSLQEKRAILATHTGNVSAHSFAAEVRYHAMFLNAPARIRLPIAGSPYASAVRADMSIGDKEFQGPTPYYHLTGRLVLAQMKYHSNEI